MRYSIIISSVLCFMFALTFTNCKSSAEKQEQVKQDSLKQAAKQDSIKLVEELKKYAIQPPNPDYSGDYVEKYDNGIVKFTGYFRFGQRHGQWIAFYDNGLKWSECSYDKGNKHGQSIVYYPNGQIQYAGWYKDDVKDSLWVFYNEQGKVLEKRAFRNGEETGLTE